MESIYKDLKDGLAHRRVVKWAGERLARWTEPHTAQILDTVAGPTHVLFSGETDAARTVVFLPGTNFCAASSLPAIEALSRGSRVISLDIPGEPGLSCGRRVMDARMSLLGSWLDDVLAQLAIHPTVVGYSLGAAIAMSAESPAITGRALICPAGIRRLRTPPAVLWPSLRWLTRPTGESSSRLLQVMCGPGQLPTVEQVEWMTLVGSSVRSGLDPGTLPDDVLRRAATNPCLVMAGEHDVFVPPQRLRDRVRSLLDAEVQALPSGHLLDEAAWAEVSVRVDQL